MSLEEVIIGPPIVNQQVPSISAFSFSSSMEKDLLEGTQENGKKHSCHEQSEGHSVIFSSTIWAFMIEHNSQRIPCDISNTPNPAHRAFCS